MIFRSEESLDSESKCPKEEVWTVKLIKVGPEKHEVRMSTVDEERHYRITEEKQKDQEILGQMLKI